MTTGAPVSSRDAGLYVHFPYCEKKCPYCDFNSHAVAFDGARYAGAVIAELELRAPAFAEAGPLRSIYFGGGTPSLWEPREVGRVILAARERFGVRPDAEITLEANPGTVHDRLFESFVAEGVNRFSIGAQSFIEPELVQLGRIHGTSEAARSVQLAKRTGARVSLDLIYGQPGQSWEQVRTSLDRAIELGPEHVSAYTLTIEPDTVLHRQAEAGRFSPMDEDDQAELIDRVTAHLAGAGYERYEISNYARPGREAIHNTIYWVGGPYLGLGAGAHSYLPEPLLAGAIRRGNVKSPDEYMSRALAREDPLGATSEKLDRRGVIGDRLFTGLRIRWGLDVAELGSEAGLPPGTLEHALAGPIAELAGEGLVEAEGSRIRPTTRGFLFADAIAKRFFVAARSLP